VNPVPDPSTPPDDAARSSIRNDLEQALFVEAGAGSGKTSSLVSRIVNLVARGVPITAIAAITFTEKAAAELRARIRAELTEALLDTDVEVATRAAAALERIDHAAIGTLHSFARRILFDFPIEAGIPPGFTVLDELESNLAFDERWEELVDDLLSEAEPCGGAVAGGRRFVELCGFDRLSLDWAVRDIARDFTANWDLVEELVSPDDPGELHIDLEPALAPVRAMAATSIPPDDPQTNLTRTMLTTVERLGVLDPAAGLRRPLELLDELKTTAGTACRRGQKPNWKDYGGDDALTAQRERAAAVVDAVDTVHAQVRAHRRLVLGVILRAFVLDGAADRRRAGRLQFHDLLVLARRLLARRPGIRALLHQRYERILLDEFQDTDPIQLEIAVRLTALPDDADQEHDWRRLQPLPGRLFIVGDPKQSIYRFRRADISEYLLAADQLGASEVTLSANFRSTRAVIDFTNEVFRELIEFEHDVQPDFQPLDACRRADLLDHGSVTVLGSGRHDELDRSWDGELGPTDELRRRESTDVAATVSAAIGQGWPVVERSDEHPDGVIRPCRPGDVAILLPSRVGLATLETALCDAGVPYRAENSSLTYSTDEIRDVLLTLRAADDPTDHLALAASLRSPLYGCSDVELYEWKTGGGSWSIWAAPPADLEAHPVAEAIAHVRTIAERVGWNTPADLIAAVVDERRVLDVALGRPDGADVWRRIRFVIEQARAWSDAGGHGLRRYLSWARLQATEGRVSETILPEPDADAVRIMTVHAAKGLEFPITVVAGLTSRSNGSSGTRAVFAGGEWMLTGKGDDGRFGAYAPIDERMNDAERRRLLYVACTRAVDHLVVSTHRGPPTKKNSDYADRAALTPAELLHVAGASTATGVDTTGFEPHPPPPRDPSRIRPVQPDVEVWAAERERALTTASRPTTIAATRLADEVRAAAEVGAATGVSAAGGPPDDEHLDTRPAGAPLPHWHRGRYGTSIGRAVHGVLQFCDLDHGSDIATLAKAKCATEGIIGLHDRVASLARSALSAPAVRHAVEGAPHWREMFVAAPVADRVLEGYVDLLVRTPEGLVIVDYKTDQWSGPAQADESVARYRLQLAAYGVALERALGEPVIGGILVRCRPDAPAEQIEIHDWQEALDDVRRLVA
jgi:ATP-dependent helicase/nuclease subunit A